MHNTNSVDRNQPFLLIGAMCIAVTLGCDRGSAPRENGVTPPINRPPVDLPIDLGDLSVLAQPWDADEDVPWQVGEILGKLSSAVYADDTEAKAVFEKLGFEKVNLNTAGSMVSYTATKGPLTVVVFRGTDDTEDWLVNLKMITSVVAGGTMHSGFHEAYQTLRPTIHASFAATKPAYVWITGHSLGGALAVVCAHDLLEADIEVNGLVTFGQPMIAKQDLATYLDGRLSKNYVRFINGADIVARVPPLYTHFGSFVWFRDEGVMHDHSRIVKLAANERIGRQDRLGPPPLNEEEFQQLQQQMKQTRATRIATPNPELPAIALPFIADHGMDRYLERIGQRGKPTPRNLSTPLEVPRPKLLPKPPEPPPFR